MAVQTDPERANGWAKFMRSIPKGALYSCSKVELRAAYDAVDDFLETNQSAMNQAIPQPARGAMNTDEKIRLYQQVLEDRRITGKIGA